jgi:hypothetical protein
MSNMTRNTEAPDHNIDLEAIARWNNEGGASGGLKRGAGSPRLYEGDFLLRQRRQQFAGSVADTPVNVSHYGGEWMALRESAQIAQVPRRENPASSVSHDLWRFSCEMPDAPHLHDNPTPP